MRHLTGALVLILIAAGVVSLVPAQSETDTSTEQGLAAFLDPFEARYEEAGGRLASALWRRAAGEPGAEGDLFTARRDLLALFADPQLVETIQRWHFRRTVARDRALRRRVEVWNQAAPAAAVELDPNVTAMADRLLGTLARHRYVLDGKPTDPDALRGILESSDDGELRRRAWLALLAPAQLIGPDLKRLNRLRAVRARDLRAPTYFDLIYQANEIDNRWLTLMLHSVRRRAEKATAELDARLRKAIRKDTLAPWDIDRAMAILSKERGADVIAARRFPASGGPAALAALVRMMGLGPSAIEERRARGPIAADFDEIMALIPGDFRLLTRREPDAPAGGPDGYAMLFRAGASALQAGATKTAAPMLKGYDWIPGTRNEIYAKARGEILASFLTDPTFLKEGLGMSPDEIRILLADQRDRALLRLRWIGLNMSMEHVMFLNPDADLDARYRESFETYTGFRLDPADPLPWMAEPSYISRPVTWFANLTALSVAAGARQLMRERFGDDPLSTGKVGPWLLETCFASGETVPLQERVSSTLKAGFDFKLYLESLGISPPTPTTPQ